MVIEQLTLGQKDMKTILYIKTLKDVKNILIDTKIQNILYGPTRKRI